MVRHRLVYDPRTFTSVLLKAWKVLVVSVFSLRSVFFTTASFTTGTDDAEAGEGFCGGFWALTTSMNMLIWHRCSRRRSSLDSFPHHAFHLPGAASAVPHESGVVNFFIRHLRSMTLLVVEIMTLLALH